MFRKVISTVGKMEADKVECLFYGNEGKPAVHPTHTKKDLIAKMVA